MANKWESPKTTRRYLHPPMAERLQVLWCEGKLVFGEAIAEITREYKKHISCGIWFLRGANGAMFDYKNGENLIPEDGIPHHGVRFREGGLTYTVEAVSECGTATPACAVRLTVANEGKSAVSDRISILFRTGREDILAWGSPDVYDSYAPLVEDWLSLPATWREQGGVITDGENWIRVKGDVPFVFSSEAGIASADITLAAGESIVAELLYDKGEQRELSYASLIEQSLSFWQGELARINKLPAGVKADARAYRTVKNLTIQLLQCFTKPQGGNGLILARQGGLQRQVWAFETMPVLEALGEIGEFDEYIEPIIECYFTDFYTESGEIRPWGRSWAMITANVLYSFAKYAMKRGEEYYLRYRDKAMRSFEWMRATRLSVVGSDLVVEGLFPPMSSCDDPLIFQSWSFPDAYNILGLRALRDAVVSFGDERAEEISAECDDYLAAARGEWERIIAESGDTDEVDFPIAPRGDIEAIMDKFIFASHTPIDAFALTEREVELVYNYRTRRGIFKNGLYNRMPDKAKTECTKCNLDENGKCIVWYVCCWEPTWFDFYKSVGRRDKMLEIIEANYKYATSKELYMCERFSERDPWFAPWMPNASANGRTILMLLSYYGEA